MTLKKLKMRLAAFGLAMAVGLLSVGNAVPVYAAEGKTGQEETAIQELPVQEPVPALHRVTAKDITKSVRDRSFSVGSCLDGIQYDPDKDEVSFNKIIGDDGSEYQSGKTGSYTATYLVTPKGGAECYVVTRKITVTDTEGAAQVSENGGQKQKTDTEPEDDTDFKTENASKKDADSKTDEESKEDVDSKTDAASKENADLKKDEESKEDADSKKDEEPKEDTDSEKDEESKENADSKKDEESKDDTDSKENTETEGITQETPKVKITASSKEDARESLDKLMEELTGGKVVIFSAAGSVPESSSATVNLDKGDAIQSPVTLKDYEINRYHINGKETYCVPVQKAAAKATDDIPSMLDSNMNLQKVLYYGYGDAGDMTGKYFSGKSGEEKYAYTHIAASYAYAGEAGLMGCGKEELENTGVMAYIDFLFGQENPPSTKLSLSSVSVDAVPDGDIQKTPEIQLEGDSRVSLNVSVPEDVTCHNVSRKESMDNGSIQIYGGDSFYLSAKGTATGQYDSGELYGSMEEEWEIITLASDGKQGIEVSEYPPAEPVRFSVNWLVQADTDTMKVSLLKKDQDTDQPLAGAVYGIYKNHPCDDSDLLMELPATDGDGKAASDPISTELKQVYLKEIQAPKGYLLNPNVYPVDVEKGEDVQMTVYDQPENVSVEGSEARFMKTDAVTGEPLEGAVLQVLDKDRELVEEWTSGKEAHVIHGLPKGEYILHEKQAPYEKGYVSASDIEFKISEEEPVTEIEMKDEYSKIDIYSKDQSTGKELSGVTLQITGKDGNVLHEWITDGKSYRAERLPVNEELTLRAMVVPKGYTLAKEMKFVLTDTKEVQSIETRVARAADKNSASGKTTAPKTGDVFQLPVVLFLACGFSAVVLAVMLIRWRRGRK